MREQADELEGWAGDALTEAEELRAAADVVEEDEDEADLLDFNTADGEEEL